MDEDESEVSEFPVDVASIGAKVVDDLGVELDWSEAGHGDDSGDPVDEVHSTIGQCFDVAKFKPVPLRRRE